MALVVVLAAACARPQPKEVRPVVDSTDTELETRIMLLQSPFGDGPHLREREAAAQWLLEHAERAYPRLLALAGTGTAGPAVVELLPAFDRTESVAVLEALLGGPERTAWVAGQGLARQRGPEALAALRRGLRHRDARAVIAAADGLAARGDRTACPDLVEAMGHADARVRYHAVQSAGRVGCLSRASLTALAEEDPDADVRELATKLLAAK
jgi:HEAT repeat protein